MRVLILCTGNSCRSQMAGGFLKRYAPGAEVLSAGTVPARTVHPLAMQVMKEKGIDLAGSRPKNVDQFLSDAFDYVVTVCDDANETCPVFVGAVRHRLHIGFEDPAKIRGDATAVLNGFRRIRDEIDAAFKEFARRIAP